MLERKEKSNRNGEKLGDLSLAYSQSSATTYGHAMDTAGEVDVIAYTPRHAVFSEEK